MLPGAKVPRSAPSPARHGEADRGGGDLGRGLPGLISRVFGPWPVSTPSVIIAFADVKE
jgi:hypothetical protein